MSWVAVGVVGGSALAGGVMGMAGRDKNKTLSQTQQGSSGGTSQSQSTFVPNPAAMPLYGMVAGQGQNFMQQPVPFFPGQTYGGPSAADQIGDALNMGMLPFMGEAAMRLYGGAGASQAGYGAANDMFGRAAAVAPGASGAYGNAAAMAPGVANAFGNAAGAYGSGAGAQAWMLPDANRNFAFLSNAADVANNPYVNAQADAMASRLNQNFKEQLLPSINQGANQVNALGSSRHALAQAQGSERTQEQLSRGLADLYGGAYQSGLGAQQAALGQTGAMLRNQLAPAEALGQAARERQLGMGVTALGGDYLTKGMDVFGQGGQYLQQGAQGLQQGQQDYASNIMNALGLGRGMVENAYGTGQRSRDFQQQALQDAMARYAYQYQEPWSRLGQAAKVAGFLQPLGVQYGSGANLGESSGIGTGANPNYQSAGQAFLGGAMSGASLGASFSDRRLKRNIERIGTTPAGYPWYRFEYLWGEPGEGVMADEVPPDWVIQHPSGYAMVDYGRVQ